MTQDAKDYPADIEKSVARIHAMVEAPDSAPFSLPMHFLESYHKVFVIYSSLIDCTSCIVKILQVSQILYFEPSLDASSFRSYVIR